MSQENVEAVRGVDEFWAPDIVWDMTPMGIQALGVYEGAEGVTACL